MEKRALIKSHWSASSMSMSAGFGTPPRSISSPRVNERLPSETAVAAIASEIVSLTVAISSIAAARGAMWCFPCAARRSALPWP
jgi:hypothetical protein